MVTALAVPRRKVSLLDEIVKYLEIVCNCRQIVMLLQMNSIVIRLWTSIYFFLFGT